MSKGTKHKLKHINKLQNAVNLIGRAGNTPIIRKFENGVKLAKFSLATTATYLEVNGKRTETQWHNIVAWGKTAQIVEKFVAKGKEVAIEGKLTTRTWEDKDGMKRYITEVVCSELLMLGK